MGPQLRRQNNQGKFRQNIRKLLSEKPPPAVQIDELFKSLDSDGSGELDSNELKRALKKLQVTAVEAANVASGAQGRMDLLHQVKRLQEVLDATLASEQACDEMIDMQSNKSSVGAQVGSIMQKKGLRAADIAASGTSPMMGPSTRPSSQGRLRHPSSGSPPSPYS